MTISCSSFDVSAIQGVAVFFRFLSMLSFCSRINTYRALTVCLEATGTQRFPGPQGIFSPVMLNGLLHGSQVPSFFLFSLFFLEINVLIFVVKAQVFLVPHNSPGFPLN